MNASPVRTICLLGVASLGLCSCTALQNGTAESARDPFQQQATFNGKTRQAESGTAHTRESALDSQTSVLRGPISIPGPPHVVPASASREAASTPVLQLNHVAADDRVPLVRQASAEGERHAGVPEADTHGPATLAKQYPDEYLFDGGDRDDPVHYSQFNRLGLDTEDALAEYSDHTGKRHVKPTNRVAVYAPRFAAVRTVGGAAVDVGSRLPAAVEDDVRLTGLETRRGTAHHKQRAVPDNVRIRSRGSGIDSRRKDFTTEQITHLALHRRRSKPLENLAFLSTGRFTSTEEAVLATGIQAAAVWSHKDSPVIVGSTRKSGEVSAKANFQEVVGSEDMRKNPGRLRIVKLADRKSARPGDVVTFTIRYDNLGDRELLHIRIVDNLTPRLEYVDDSATSDRAGRLVVEDNLEGSLVLKFEIKDPLPGHQGGVVTFKAKVR